MRTTLLLIPLLAANAYAADPAVTLQAQPLAQPLAPARTSQAGVKTTAASKIFAGPKIHETVATRNADGSLAVGCVERPNPRASKPSTRTNVPEAQQ